MAAFLSPFYRIRSRKIGGIRNEKIIQSTRKHLDLNGSDSINGMRQYGGQ
jgi:hypothetical protein